MTSPELGIETKLEVRRSALVTGDWDLADAMLKGMLERGPVGPTCPVAIRGLPQPRHLQPNGFQLNREQARKVARTAENFLAEA